MRNLIDACPRCGHEPSPGQTDRDSLREHLDGCTDQGAHRAHRKAVATAEAKGARKAAGVDAQAEAQNLAAWRAASAARPKHNHNRVAGWVDSGNSHMTPTTWPQPEDPARPSRGKPPPTRRPRDDPPRHSQMAVPRRRCWLDVATHRHPAAEAV